MELKMRLRLCALLLAGAGWPAAIAAAATINPAPALPVTTHGQTITVSGEGFPSSPIQVYLRTGNEGVNDKGFPIPGTAGVDGKSVTFKVPNDAPVGDFLVVLGVGGQELPVPGELRITPDAAAAVTLDSVSPATDYRAPNHEGFRFVMSGHNLARVAADNTVIEVGVGALSVGSPAQCASLDAMNKSRKICLSYDPGMEGQKLNVANFRAQHLEGPVSFAVQVGNNVSSAQKITFSLVRARTLRWVAVGIFCALAAIVFALVYGGIKQSKLAGETTGVLMAFFLDRQTNSYSLSKFQVIAWTVVAVFAYVYLFLCRTCIQWTFSFPPVPGGLPILLGLSAGTTVTAMSITANRGSKGAGPMHPSLADFVTTGGLVAGERFQYFVWTLVGCLGFLGIVLSADPASLTQMPDIPATFLILMGVSSAGYLAGKVVRDPGPIIDLLTVTEVIAQDENHPAVMKIQLKGQNLSDKAVVKIDQKELRISQFTVNGITRQDQPANSPFYTSLEVDLLDAEFYRTGSHLLYLVNSDGQAACECFPMNPVTVNPVAARPFAAVPQTVNLVGNNFAAGIQITWVDANKNRFIIPANDFAVVDANHINVTFTPAGAGAGKLVLETPTHLQAIVPVVFT
jgi:hypothetical protein